MAAPKRFRLTQGIIDSWYTESGQYKFRVGFDRDNGTCICGPKLCPLIQIADTDVVQTTNATAQKYLAESQVPQGIRINGQRPPAGPVWEDVTNIIPVANVDLDPYFPS